MIGNTNRLIVNEDDTHFYYTRSWNNIEPDRTEIERFADQYKADEVAAVILTCCGRMSSRPSKCREGFSDKYYQKFENGAAVDYSNHPVVKCVHRIQELGLDFYDICLKRLQKNGVEGWLSVRMNDIHDSFNPQSFLHPAFYHEHPEYRRIRHRKAIGYFDNCFDYSKEEVRKYVLNYIEELADSYDFDGLEVDWQREAHCFAPGGEWEGTKISLEVMRTVRGILNRMEQRVGHPVMLGVRIPATPQACLDMGFDVAAWAKEGLIQQAAPDSRWETTDTDLPVELWKRLLQGTGCRLTPGTEVLIRSTPDSKILSQTAETTCGTAAAYLSMGADAFYLFNYMDSPVQKPDAGFLGKPGEYAGLLSILGDESKVTACARRHRLSYNDMGPVWFRKASCAALPLAVKAGEPAFLRIRTGAIGEGRKVFLRLGIRDANADVYVNCAKVALVQTAPFEAQLSSHEAALYEIPAEGVRQGFQVIEILSAEGGNDIDFAEIIVEEA